MGAKAREEEAADVAVVVVAVHLLDVAVAVCAHEHVQLLPERVHGGRRPRSPYPRRGECGSAGEARKRGFFRVSTERASERRFPLRGRGGEGEGGGGVRSGGFV